MKIVYSIYRCGIPVSIKTTYEEFLVVILGRWVLHLATILIFFQMQNFHQATVQEST